MFKVGDLVTWSYYNGIINGKGIIKKIVTGESQYALIDTGRVDGLYSVPLSVLKPQEEQGEEEERFLANDPIEW